MATINPPLARINLRLNLLHAIRLAAVVVCLLLIACQSSLNASPDAVTDEFWQAVIDGDTDKAKSYATHDSQYLLESTNKRYTDVEVGSTKLNGDKALVNTTLSTNHAPISFDTVLLKENNLWKVDYQQTRLNVSVSPFAGILQQLQDIGETFGSELQEQMPEIEKNLQNFGEHLKQELEKFNQSLEKAIPPSKQQNPKNSF